MTHKTILPLIAVALLIVSPPRADAFVVPANCPVGSPSSAIAHGQATLGPETLLVCPYDPNDGGHPYITRTYTVTNNTTTPWTDYHFHVSLGEGTPTSFGWDATTPLNLVVDGVANAATHQFAGDEFSLFFNAPVDPSENFRVQLRFGSYGAEQTATVTGTPSVPEPGTLALLGLGLGAFGALRRRTRTA